MKPLMDDGWDPVPAYLYMMLQESNNGRRGREITQAKLVAWGQKIKLYKGVTRIFALLRKQAHAISPDINIEYYLVSSGIGEVLRASRVAKYFDDIWACDFHYDDNGRIAFPKNIISFTDKTRYLFHISKGIIGPESRHKPFEVNRKIDFPDLHIPIDQMIFVGDGYTDIPCFSMLQKQGGIAIGVYDPEDRERWGRAWGFITEGRVSNLSPTNYSKNSALRLSLMMAVEHIARRIALTRQTYQG